MNLLETATVYPMPGTALPPVSVVTDSYGLGANDINAYNVCLELEKLTGADQKKLVYPRILGYLLIHSPSHAARLEVTKVIHSCAGDSSKLYELGQTFLFGLVIKKYKSRTPGSSEHSSRHSFDLLERDLTSTIQESPKTHKEAKARALVRDNFRCVVVTGMYHRGSLSHISASLEDIRASHVVRTQCAHIVPDSVYFDLIDKKLEYTASVLAVLKSFGYDVEQLNGAKYHSLYNVMTLQHDGHEMFDYLELWFERTNTKNRYKVVTADDLHPLPEYVTFTTSDEKNLPVPSEQLLALHAACAKIAHLSGAGEYLDELDRDEEDLGVLAHDGSSAEVLNSAIWNKVKIDNVTNCP